MESSLTVDERPLYRSIWRVSRHRTGTTYIVVPKEFASLAGLNDGSQVELGIFRIHQRKGEKK